MTNLNHIAIKENIGPLIYILWLAWKTPEIILLNGEPHIFNSNESSFSD